MKNAPTSYVLLSVYCFRKLQYFIHLRYIFSVNDAARESETE